jgi:hypothetical protein
VGSRHPRGSTTVEARADAAISLWRYPYGIEERLSFASGPLSNSVLNHSGSRGFSPSSGALGCGHGMPMAPQVQACSLQASCGPRIEGISCYNLIFATKEGDISPRRAAVARFNNATDAPYDPLHDRALQRVSRSCARSGLSVVCGDRRGANRL